MKVLLKWFPFAVIAVALSGLIYVMGQQVLRQMANDPQIQMSEDIASELAQGGDPKKVISSQQLDISKTLSPFVIVYDDADKSVISTGLLDGEAPNVPTGVLEYTRQHGQDRITWQPRPNVRVAIVVTHFDGKAKGFVLVGRSLRETEVRASRLLQVMMMGTAVTLVGLYLVIFVVVQLKKQRK